MSLERLPQNVRARLAELQGELSRVFGSDLRALLLYGSAARGEYREQQSDLDLVLVLDDDDEDKLEACGPALTLARFSARIEVMIVRYDEIARASDCFPLLYADIARSSVVLQGRNPFAGLAIGEEYKRVRVEQELREARIRLRRVVADCAADLPQLGRAIERKVKQLRTPLWALGVMRGKDVPEQLDHVLRMAGDLYGVDVAPLLRARETPREAAVCVRTLLERALADVDDSPKASVAPRSGNPNVDDSPKASVAPRSGNTDVDDSPKASVAPRIGNTDVASNPEG